MSYEAAERLKCMLRLIRHRSLPAPTSWFPVVYDQYKVKADQEFKYR